MSPWRQELRSLAKIALPAVVIQIGMMAMGTVDIMMVGHYSETALAGVTLGHLYVMCLVITGLGVLLAVDPLVSQAVGAKDSVGVSRAVQRGLVLAVGLAIPAMLLCVPAAEFFEASGQQPNVVPHATAYVLRNIPGILPFLVFIVLRTTLQALHRLVPIIITVMIANAVNALLNWTFIYGHFGFPAMGAGGAAWATSIGRWTMTLMLLGFGWKELKPHLLPWRTEALDGRALRKMLGLGAPLGAQLFFEYGIFALTGILIGRIGEHELGGHQIALNLASNTYMVPLGISIGVSVRVGYAIGAERMDRARLSANAALVAGATLMTVCGVVLFLAPVFFSKLYTEKTEVLAVAMVLVPIAAIFQIFDGIQCVAIGILRGLGDTRAPILLNLIGYWLVGLPAGLFLAYARDGGAEGLWWGLVVGLAATAALLLWRVRSRLARDIRRILIDVAEAPKGAP